MFQLLCVYFGTACKECRHRHYGSSSSFAHMLAYEHLDGELRRDLPRPQDNSTIPGMLEELRHQKDIWFDIYGSHE